MNPTTNKPTLQQQNGHPSPSTANGTAPAAKRRKRRRYLPAVDTRPPIKRVLPKLDRAKSRSPGRWTARCPAHNDTKPSLSISVKADGTVLLHCHTGCKIEEIVAAMGMTMAELYPAGSAGANGRRPAPAKASGRDRISASAKESGANSKPERHRRTNARPKSNRERRARKYAKALSRQQLRKLADKLSVPPASLRALGIGWRKTKSGGVYTFPEYDGSGRVIGISTRAESGAKKMIKGSNRGLYLPTGWLDRTGPIFVAEGATCTAGLTAMGLAGIGRPSNAGGADQLAKLLCKVPRDRRIVVLGEYDRKTDGSWPGRDGAVAVATTLSNKLGRRVLWSLPPDGAKDVREWFLQQTGRQS